MLLERDNREHPVPIELRPTFAKIAEAFASADYNLLDHSIERVSLADAETASYIADCVAAYGDPITGLDPSTWQRSCYLCLGDHWQALVDLATANEKVSDLTLHARIFIDPDVRIVIDSVHVP